MKWWFRQQLYLQILACIALGAGLGLILGPGARAIEPIGEIFLRLLKMLIVPLTFFTLVSGVTKMGDLASLRSVGGATLLYYCATSLCAAAIGVAVALVLRPGKEAAGLIRQGEQVEPAPFDFIDNVVGWVPANPIKAFAETEMLQIIFFALIVGVGLLLLGRKAERISRLADEGAELMLKITDIVMKVAPYGVLALTANMVGTLGSKMLWEMGRLILADTLAIVLVLAVVYPLLLKILGRKNPVRFYRNAAPAMLVAASTTSSAATLPVSMEVAERNLGVPKRIYGFTLPLGATVNMDGLAASIGIIAVFASNLYGLPLTTGLLLQFAFLGLILSVGAAGVKGSGIVMSTILLQTLNLPLTLIPILAAIWPIIDIAHTTCNVTGDLVGTTLVAARFGELDEEVYQGGKAPESRSEGIPEIPEPAGEATRI